MVREVNLIGYLPEYMQEYKEMQYIMLAENREVQDVEDESEVVMNNQFIMNCDEDGIKRFETMLGVTALDTDTLEDRIFRVRTLWNKSTPYTKISLNRMLALLCGEDGYTLEIFPEKIVKVRVELKRKKNYEDVKKLLESVVPMNMIINLSLRYNQHYTLGKLTHRQLAFYTHNQIRNEVI